MDKEFLKWLEAERDEATSLMIRAEKVDRVNFWCHHHNMLSDAVEEIKAAMYKEATGK